jgi:hypothetical protein
MHKQLMRKHHGHVDSRAEERGQFVADFANAAIVEVWTADNGAFKWCFWPLLRYLVCRLFVPGTHRLRPCVPPAPEPPRQRLLLYFFRDSSVTLTISRRGDRRRVLERTAQTGQVGCGFCFIISRQRATVCER